MARNQNTFAKQQREMEKRRKAEQKRLRRLQRKSAPPETEVKSEPAEDEVDD